MAGTAEQFEQSGFDREYYEIQRRLAIAPAIGGAALLLENVTGIEQRRRDELVDGIAEAIPGIVRNERSYRLVNGVLVARDGRSFEDLLNHGLANATLETSRDSFYMNFRPQRAQHELDEARDWQNAASGDMDFNTVLTYSPYSEEYCSAETIRKLEKAGQEPGRKRAMIRMGHWDGQEFHVIVRSIDNSSLDILQAASEIATGYRFVANNSTDMLGERQRMQMSISEAYGLMENIVDKADNLIGNELGESTKQGRPVSEAHNAQQYVESQSQIINELLEVGRMLAAQHPNYQSYEQAWHQQLHKYTALIKLRMGAGRIDEIMDIAAAASAAGAVATARGETYNMCGLIISADGKPPIGNETGFESLQRLAGKKIECPACKEKVVVPDAKLKEGVLCCSECKFEIDACTGKVVNKPKSRRTSQIEERSKKETDWQRIVREDEQKKLRRRLERQQADRERRAA